jgi:hypothetical protein
MRDDLGEIEVKFGQRATGVVDAGKQAEDVDRAARCAANIG